MLKGSLIEITIQLIHLQPKTLYSTNAVILGNKPCNCRDMKEGSHVIKKEKPTTISEKKENSTKEDCRLALIKEDEWHIDSGF